MERPFVTVHFAQSLDGHIDRPSGSSHLLLSRDAGFDVAHRTRAEHDAVLVGLGTVLRDDPRLLVSRVAGPHPHRVVLDSEVRTPTSARLLLKTAGTSVFVLGTKQACSQRVQNLQNCGAHVQLFASTSDNQVPLKEALFHLYQLGIRRLLVEGGARVIQSFVRAHSVDRVQVEVAPMVVGRGGLPGLGNSDAGFRLEQVSVQPMGEHVLICGKPQFGSVSG